MALGSAQPMAQRWIARARLTILVLLVLQVQVAGTGWPREPAPARIDDEMTKQEKIYGSRGADVPSGYVTDRALTDYAELLTSDFCAALSNLGSSDRWLDIGAGTGQAILDYYAFEENGAQAQKCARSWSKARVVALSIEDRRTDTWRQQAAIFGDRLRYLAGKRLRYYSREELGTFHIITDVYGGFSYTEDLSGFLSKVLSLLETGGVFYTELQDVHLADGKDKLDSGYLTELVDAAGHDVKVCSWLKQTTCVKVTCESKSDWDEPTELINVRKVCSDVSVPRTKLLKYEAGNPPERHFRLEP